MWRLEMREYFIRIFNEYNNAKEEDFNLNHSLARFIQYDFPVSIKLNDLDNSI